MGGGRAHLCSDLICPPPPHTHTHSHRPHPPHPHPRTHPARVSQACKEARARTGLPRDAVAAVCAADASQPWVTAEAMSGVAAMDEAS